MADGWPARHAVIGPLPGARPTLTVEPPVIERVAEADTDAPEDLTGPELRLWEAFATGDEVDLRPRDAADGGAVADGAGWEPEHTVRASIIRSLVLGGAESVQGDSRRDWGRGRGWGCHPAPPGGRSPACRRPSVRVRDRLLAAAASLPKAPCPPCAVAAASGQVSFEGAPSRVPRARPWPASTSRPPNWSCDRRGRRTVSTCATPPWAHRGSMTTTIAPVHRNDSTDSSTSRWSRTFPSASVRPC